MHIQTLWNFATFTDTALNFVREELESVVHMKRLFKLDKCGTGVVCHLPHVTVFVILKQLKLNGVPSLLLCLCNHSRWSQYGCVGLVQLQSLPRCRRNHCMQVINCIHQLQNICYCFLSGHSTNICTDAGWRWFYTLPSWLFWRKGICLTVSVLLHWFHCVALTEPESCSVFA